jgi:hypothetical protein
VDEPAYYREEIVALPFDVSSILRTLERIELLLQEDVDDGEEDEG